MTRMPVAAGFMVLALSPALAQTPPGPFLTEAPGALRASQIRGLGVIGQDHVRIGSIEDVVIGREGRAEAVVIGVGGFLGIGEKRVAVPFADLVWNVDAGPTDGPRGSTPGGSAGSGAETPPSRPELMPGAEIKPGVLASTQEQTSGAVNPGTGPVLTASTPQASGTVPVDGSGLRNAQVRMTKAELSAAPEFQAR